MYISGHDHNKQLIQYEGMNYIVTGAGGMHSSTTGSEGKDYPRGSLQYHDPNNGFVGLRFCDKKTAQLTFYGKSGDVETTFSLVGEQASATSNIIPESRRRLPQQTCNGRKMLDVQNTCSLDGCTVLVTTDKTSLTGMDSRSNIWAKADALFGSQKKKEVAAG